MKKDQERALRHERLGENFYFGCTVKKDLELARKHFGLAALYGEGEIKAEALCNLALLTSEPYAKLTLYAQAAEEGCADALNMIGVFLERTSDKDAEIPGLPDSTLGEALDWYREAARAGSADGMYNCAVRVKDSKEKTQYLEQAAQYGHAKAIQMLRKACEEDEKRQSQAAEMLKPFLDAAKAWEEKPVAILRVSASEMSELWKDKRYRYNQTQLAFDVAVTLQRSVILLFDNKRNNTLSCVGYDLQKIGLADAMNNECTDYDGWGIGSFTIVSIQAEDQKLFCEKVISSINFAREFLY